MTYILAALIAAAFYAVTRLDVAVRLSPDGGFYIKSAKGEPTPTPYRLRWLPVVLCGDSALRWQILTGASLIAWGPAIAWYLSALGMEPWQQLAGVVLLCGLPGMFRLNVTLPVLVDAPAFLLALVSASLAVSGHPLLAVSASLAAGASKESAPVFASAFALSPWPLVGLLACGWWRKAATGTEAWLQRPVTEALKAHRGHWLDWRVMLLPWGVLWVLAPLAAGMNRATVAAGLCLTLGYAQMLRSQDRARLFGWAAPVVIALGLIALPLEWSGPVLLVHAFNPYRGV